MSDQCASCGAPITWEVTANGRRRPLDADGRTHFITCPNAAQHRTSGRERQAEPSGGPIALVHAPARGPEEAGSLTLLELWALPLEEQQRRRKHERWDHLRYLQLSRENAAPDFPKLGGYYLLEEQRTGKTIVVDPSRPWNDARVFVHENREVAREWCVEHAFVELVGHLTPEGEEFVKRGELKPGDFVELRFTPKQETGDWDDVEPLTLRGAV